VDTNYDIIINKLEQIKKVSKNGGHYWMGREIQQVLGYDKWDKFENVINKAIMACESSGEYPDKHFLQTGKMVSIGSGAQRSLKDYYLTRYGCYLVAMNGDTGKPEIGYAQTYFAVQTRKQEVQDQLTADQRRILLRERVKDANKSLNSTAKKSGVQKFGVFQDSGYQGLYEMGLADIKKKKGILEKEHLLDRAGRTELAANEFRITQTEDKLIRDNVASEKHAINTHREVGKEVRKTIDKLGGIMPENLPPEEPIKKLMSKYKKKMKALPKENLKIND
jgi:DNA-damage-inducible protein D